MWAGKQELPVEPFVGAFYDFDVQPRGFVPLDKLPIGGEHKLSQQHFLNLCCTMLMTSNSDVDQKTYPLYFHWYTKLPAGAPKAI